MTSKVQHLPASELVRLIGVSLHEQHVDYDAVIERFGQVRASEEHTRGRQFDLRDHVKGLVLSLLSNQRPWRQIEENLEPIESIFFGYSPTKLKNANPSRIENALRTIRCGNRSIRKQLADLATNIETFERIGSEHGSVDCFVTSAPPDAIARQLSNGGYKLKQVGFTLALEYLRNVGVRAPKSDLHIIRLLGADRLNYFPGEPSPQRAYNIMIELADEAEVNRTYLDNLIWLFCAKGYGEICGERPRCGLCHLQHWCAYPTRPI